MLRPHNLGVAVGAMILAVAAGCSQKGPECNSVVKVINPAAEKIKNAEGKGDKAADHIRAMNEIAAASEGAASELAKLQLTVPEVKKLAGEYQTMAKGVAVAARDMAQAVQTTEEASTRIQKTTSDLQATIAKYTGACAAKLGKKDTDACKRFTEGITKLPNDGTKTDEVEKVSAGMDAIEWESDQVKTAAKAVVAALRANNKVMIDTVAAQKKAQAAEKHFGEAAQQEDKIVDGLNRFCRD